jgi:uncharacterized protein (TIGR02646 family)
MKGIQKRREPASLTAHRAATGTDYDGYRDKDTLRAYLVREQRGLCCYCLSRIRPELDSTKIEHWRCQAKYEVERLNYSNLLGSCTGGEGQPPKDRHCDTRKGDLDLSRNPADPMHRVEDVIQFLGDGRIASNDPVFDAELNGVLNLNLPFLRNNRKQTLTAFKDALAKRGQLPTTALERWLRTWSGEGGAGDLEPFCQVVVYWLRKRLARP